VKSGWSSDLDLFLGLNLDLGRAGGVRDGIERSLRQAMREGRLALGAALPSTRSLARDLGVARGTVSAAYSQLAAEGLLDLRQGAPARVRWTPRDQPPATPPPAPAAGIRWDFRPGQPHGASFPRQGWMRAARRVLATAPDEIFGYGDPRGHAELRRVLAEYLGRARGVDTSAGRLVVCNGFTQALSLICQVLRAAGTGTLAIETPGAPRYRQLAEAAGLFVVPVPCDQEGLRTEDLTRSGAGAVLVTPAHQYPLGVTLSAGRRTALVQWARRHRAVIIEDDYDGEFRYDRQPVGALQSLDPERVIYVGTASKTLAPGLRLGWLSPPSALSGALEAAKDHCDRSTGVLDQLTAAEFIASGGFDRHVRHMRGVYRRRRDLLAQVLAQSSPGVRLEGISAGLHALAYLPGAGPPAAEIVSRAARSSMALHTLASYWHGQPEPAPEAIIVGYGTPADHAFRPALDALTRLLAR
jgi:GntR family transcriptional regulator / MocR family aminotransferase